MEQKNKYKIAYTKDFLSKNVIRIQNDKVHIQAKENVFSQTKMKLSQIKKPEQKQKKTLYFKVLPTVKTVRFKV